MCKGYLRSLVGCLVVLHSVTMLAADGKAPEGKDKKPSGTWKGVLWGIHKSAHERLVAENERLAGELKIAKQRARDAERRAETLKEQMAAYRLRFPDPGSMEKQVAAILYEKDVAAGKQPLAVNLAITVEDTYSFEVPVKYLPAGSLFAKAILDILRKHVEDGTLQRETNEQGEETFKVDLSNFFKRSFGPTHPLIYSARVEYALNQLRKIFESLYELYKHSESDYRFQTVDAYKWILQFQDENKVADFYKLLGFRVDFSAVHHNAFSLKLLDEVSYSPES